MASADLVFPQSIAHRGFCSAWPENSMAAFYAALGGADGSSSSSSSKKKAGTAPAQAIETDVHLSRDGTVVLSHDATLRRCFGQPERIAECDWATDLAGLRTVRAPHEPLARLEELLALLAEPGQEGVWVLLDIKRDDPREKLIGRIAETIEAADAGGRWNERVVLGCWTPADIRLCIDRLPGFPIAFIGFDLALARALLPYDAVTHYNLQQTLLLGNKAGAAFLADAHARRRRVLAWTVNEVEWMEQCVHRGLDGVVTDDPALFREVCGRWSGEEEKDGKKTFLIGRPPLPLHPASAHSFTGRYLRRWARLYGVYGFVRTAVFVLCRVLRVAWGSPEQRVHRALGKAETAAEAH